MPGSGRTTAIEKMRGDYPGLIFVDADPRVQGEAFSDREAHDNSLKEAVENIATYIKHGVKVIAVETSTPFSQDVSRLIYPALVANYTVEIAPLAVKDPFDVMTCARNSSHEPDPDYLYRIAAEWEEVDFKIEETPKNRALEALRRKKAWTAYTMALASVSAAQAETSMKEVYETYPEEASALMLPSGPSWGRLNLNTCPPIYPWARISPYWGAIENEAAGLPAEEYRRPKTPLPTPSFPEQSRGF